MSNIKKPLPEFIKLFLSTESLRPIMNGIFYDGTYANATDASSAIRWKDDNPDINPKAPNVNAVYSDPLRSAFYIFSKDYYENWKENLPLVNEKIDCSECEGEGDVEWSYDGKNGYYEEKHDCPVCEGDASFYTGNKIPDPNKYYEICNHGFQQKNIDRLIKVMDHFSLKFCDINFSPDRPLAGHLVNIDIFELLIMPVVLNP